jgi:hypothetical protein
MERRPYQRWCPRCLVAGVDVDYGVVAITAVGSQRCLDLLDARLILVGSQRYNLQTRINRSSGCVIAIVARHEVRMQVRHQVTKQIEVHFDGRIGAIEDSSPCCVQTKKE